MANCIKCGNTNLEWVKDNNKWRLYDSTTGVWHDKICKPTPSELVQAREIKKASQACRHGILLTSYCDLCAEIN